MTFKQALDALDKHALTILTSERSNVKLLAIGTKDHGPLSGATDFCINAYVPKKLTAGELGDRAIPSIDVMAAHAMGRDAAERIPFNVVESGSDFHPRQLMCVPAAQRGLHGGPPPTIDPQKYFDELRCGIGITNPVSQYPAYLSVGTLGFFVIDDQQKLHLVSNSHVIARSGAAAAGEPIVQPGTLDLTQLEMQQMNTLAKLTRRLEIARLSAVVPFQFQTPGNIPKNRVDAAMAELTDSGRGRADIDRLTFGGGIVDMAKPYKVDSSGKIADSARVYKVGRTTGYTEGRIVGLAGTGTLDYPTGSAYFVGQIVIEGTPDNGGLFSDRGDSGSAILNDSHKVVGLLFAGSAQQTLANPIADVMRELQSAAGAASLKLVTL